VLSILGVSALIIPLRVSQQLVRFDVPLMIGSRWFTDLAVTLARQFGISELVIGLTIVAAVTSLPEVATSW
jgi:cation:H+ antiporter